MIVVRRDRLATVPVVDALTYDAEVAVGRSLGPLPDGWHHVDRSWDLPDGSFQTAAAYVLSWSMHRAAGLVIAADAPRAVEGTVVRQGVPLLCLVIVAPCRVVRVLDEPDARGFCYGTVRGHPECGEESFVVRREGPRTRLEIRSFSRAGDRLVALGTPVNRFLQGRAVGRFGAAVVAACS